MTNQATVLKVEKLCKAYQEAQGENQVIDHLDLGLSAGETMAIMGASGCGKSTLLHCLAGLDQFQSGDVCLLGQQIQTLNESQLCALRNQNVGFIYQFHHLLPEFNALENVMMPLWLQQDQADIKQHALDLLDKVGMKHKAEQSIQTLSGGERQRVAIARALVSSPKIIFADEPTGNLDEDTAKTVMTLLLELNQSLNCALVMVTHNKDLAQLLDHQYRLQQGKLHKVI
jgi:lipoprotein-releasing system ATP-binding protein